jgi:hypothetical protein
LGTELNCPAGFSRFIDTCVKINSNLPANTTYASAVASCLASGQQILNVDSHYLNEAVRSYLVDTKANTNLWIGPVPGTRIIIFIVCSDTTRAII